MFLGQLCDGPSGLFIFILAKQRKGREESVSSASTTSHACTPCFPLPYRNICIIKGEESSHHSQPLLLPIHPREIQGDMIEQEGTRIMGKMFIACGCFYRDNGKQ